MELSPPAHGENRRPDPAVDATMQEQAKALGDPTRHAIFRHIADAAQGLDVAALTAALGCNHNAIRQHLAKLVHAELVVERPAPANGPGRPRLTYTVHPAAESRWGVIGPYERLSALLAEITRTGDSPVEVGRRSVADHRDSQLEGDPIGLVVDQMARQGFDPSVRSRDTRVEVTLARCPFVTAALVDPDTVCSLHLGIAQGTAALADGSTARVLVETLVRRDPRQAGCHLVLCLAPGPRT